MPSPKFVLEGRKTDPGVTNIRNTKSPHWRRWLEPEHRCLVPLTSFSEFDTVDGKKVPAWFAAKAIPICAGPDRAARKVTCVYDGDTGWERGRKWRLLDIDAPELGSRDAGCRAELRR